MNHVINSTHNEIIKNGWSCVAVAGPCVSGPYSDKDIYRKNIYRKSSPYDEFIIEHYSSDEVCITVPIPFRDSSIAYKNTFRSENMGDIQEYIKLHLSNNNRQ